MCSKQGHLDSGESNPQGLGSSYDICTGASGMPLCVLNRGLEAGEPQLPEMGAFQPSAYAPPPLSVPG